MRPTTSAMIPIVHTIGILATKPMMSRMIPRMITGPPELPCWNQVPDGDCQEGRSGKSAERAVTSAGMTYGRENLGGFVTTVSLCRKTAGLRIFTFLAPQCALL